MTAGCIGSSTCISTTRTCATSGRSRRLSPTATPSRSCRPSPAGNAPPGSPSADTAFWSKFRPFDAWEIHRDHTYADRTYGRAWTDVPTMEGSDARACHGRARRPPARAAVRGGGDAAREADAFDLGRLERGQGAGDRRNDAVHRRRLHERDLARRHDVAAPWPPRRDRPHDR